VFNETDLFLLSQAHEVFVNRTAGDNGKLGDKLFTSIGQWIPSFSTKDPRTYCDEIASTRNWFTHFNPKYDARDKDRSYEYLYEYCKVLEITYIALILKLSGVGGTALTQLVSSMIDESRGFFVGTVSPPQHA
jgi:ApeA N-terminal domain 1